MSPPRKPKARTVESNRAQGVIRFEMPELILPSTHRARVDLSDSPTRMETEEAQRLYRACAGLVELTNAHVKKQLGIDHVLVRGLAKVTCVALLGSLAFNILQNATRLLS